MEQGGIRDPEWFNLERLVQITVRFLALHAFVLEENKFKDLFLKLCHDLVVMLHSLVARLIPAPQVETPLKITLKRVVRLAGSHTVPPNTDDNAAPG